jgi:hypothetical protein
MAGDISSKAFNKQMFAVPTALTTLVGVEKKPF